jgi:hypothetical protein
MPVTDSRAHDDGVQDAVRGPEPGEAREALEYWRDRLQRLPRRRRADRREAQAMVVAWEQRLRGAEIERWGGGMIGRLAATVAVARTLRPGMLARRAVGLVPRSLAVGVLTVVLGSVLIMGIVLGAILSALL